MLISKEYTKLNAEMHVNRPGFGCGGARWARTITDLAIKYSTTSVLDYGCGKGVLAATMAFPISEYDPAVAEKSAQPEQAEIVVCTDVLEHIEPDCLRDVLRHIAALTGSVAFLNISTRKAHKNLADGRNAHLIVNDSRWWDRVLEEFFRKIDMVSVSPTEYNVLVYPRK
jgi:2-polyprenyl-3-methyl-5-hydroxy-6-metoxy-1,4-benzoquinol methylase